MKPQDKDYQALAEFRFALRRFLAFSEQAAKESGLTAQQHQAILAVRGAPGGELSVGELAARLLIRHHSAVELANRLVKAGLVVRRQAEADRRSVLLSLTPQAARILEGLSAAHLDELRSSRDKLAEIIGRLNP
jgi:DNA-binding MarR family transcriptional regulator